MAAPLQTDEPVDRYYSRPIAAVLVKLLAPTRITPNQVTGVAALFGVASGAALILERSVLAAVFLAAFLALDCVDGQLARLRGGGNYIGRAVDGLGDYTTAMAVHFGMAFRLWQDGMALYVVLPLLSVAAVSMAWSSFLLDRYKHRYRGDMDDVEAMRREAAATGGIKARLILSLIPYSERLAGSIRVPDLAAYQARVRAAMRLWLLCGPTMHFTAMTVCFAFDQLYLYPWIAIVPLNLLTVVALLVQRRLERRPPAVVESGRATAA